MTTPANNATFYADFKSLDVLKHEAKTQSQQSLRGAAQQFESLFINMMLKSARSASATVGDSLTGGSEMDLYQGMFDEQIATQMAKGKGLGLADMLVQQLNRSGMVKSAAPAPSSSGNINKTAAPAAQPAVQPSSQPAVTTSSTSSLQATSPADFVQKMWPHAQAAAQKLGVDPTTLIAHAALETGWGKHVPCNADGSSSFNLFGIKAGSSWSGQSIGAPTLEFSQGVAVKRVERFKAYDSPEQCFADYASLLSGHTRYGAALNTGNNAAQFAHALKQGGYATDPNYVAKLKAVARSVMSIVSGVASTSLAGTVTQVHSARVDT